MTNYVLNEEKMFADIADGIAIIINSETGIYYGMNSFGTMIFDNIINGAPIEKISETVKRISQAPQNIDEILNNFVKDMVEKEIITAGDSADSEVTIDETIAKNDNFTLELKEYDDTQELLLADPIHEVREETGWKPEKTALNEDEEDVARREAKMES